MPQNKVDFKKLKELTIPIVNEIIGIMKDMALAVPQKYDENKMSPFRKLCLGYLLICKNNVEAALRLLESNLTDQINYINRNMFEILVTLYYIDDDGDKKEERVERYFEYNDAVLNYKVGKILRKYPNLVKQKLPNEVDKSIDEEYKNFVNKYQKKDGKKPNEQSWSGLNLFEMLDDLTDKTTKEMLLKNYQIMVKMNNDFLHPTIAHIRSAARDFYSGNVDHRVGVLQIRAILHLAGFIMTKFLTQFQKGRPALKARIDEATKKLIEIDSAFGML